jgi:hypothetical protein
MILRICFYVCIGMFIMFIPAIAGTKAKEYYVIADIANVRSEPNANAQVTSYLYVGNGFTSLKHQTSGYI